MSQTIANESRLQVYSDGVKLWHTQVLLVSSLCKRTWYSKWESRTDNDVFLMLACYCWSFSSYPE